MLVLSARHFAKTSLPTSMFTERFSLLTTNRVIFRFKILGQISLYGKIFGKSYTLDHYLMTLTLKQDQDLLTQQRSQKSSNQLRFLSKEPITGWILYATRNQPTQVLVCGTGSPGELSFTAIPKQLTKDPTFWFRNRYCSHN